MSDKLAAIKRQRMKEKIELVYRNYVAKTPGSEEDFFKTVTAFAKGKVTKALFDQRELEDNADDHAQEVAIKVWTKLDTFKGQPESFYPWLHRICFTQKVDAFNTSMDEASKRVEMFLEFEDGTKEENPVLYRESHRTQLRRRLPDWIQGADLRICQYIREGYDYKLIGDLMEMTESAVKQRVAYMKRRIQKEKAAK